MTREDDEAATRLHGAYRHLSRLGATDEHMLNVHGMQVAVGDLKLAAAALYVRGVESPKPDDRELKRLKRKIRKQRRVLAAGARAC